MAGRGARASPAAAAAADDDDDDGTCAIAGVARPSFPALLPEKGGTQRTSEVIKRQSWLIGGRSPTYYKCEVTHDARREGCRGENELHARVLGVLAPLEMQLVNLLLKRSHLMREAIRRNRKLMRSS